MSNIFRGFVVKKKAKVNNPKFVAATSIFRMTVPYKKFSLYFDTLVETCRKNKDREIVIRIYYDQSMEDDMEIFAKNDNVELVKYNFPCIKEGKSHAGTFGTFMRMVPLFEPEHAICTCFDADMLLDYKEIMKCVKIMEKTSSAFYALAYDNPLIHNVEQKFGKSVINEYIMATYIAFPGILNLPRNILSDFVKKAFARDKSLNKWIQLNNIGKGTVFAYGLDEYCMNVILLVLF